MKTQINYRMMPGSKPKGNQEGGPVEEKPMVASFQQNEHPIFSRAVIFDQEINEMTSVALRAEVMAKSAENPEAPIYLFLGSPGGGLYESLAIYDTFQSISNPIVAICSGKVMSGGILILLGCQARVATPNTTFMIHHGHTTLTGNVVQLKEQRDEIESLNDRMLDIIIKKTKITREQLKAWLVKDHYMNTNAAIQSGLIHGELEKLSQLLPVEEEAVELVVEKPIKKAKKKPVKKISKKK